MSAHLTFVRKQDDADGPDCRFAREAPIVEELGVGLKPFPRLLQLLLLLLLLLLRVSASLSVRVLEWSKGPTPRTRPLVAITTHPGQPGWITGFNSKVVRPVTLGQGDAR